MLVRATQLVFYGLKRRRPGTEFEISSADEFSEKCMDWVGEPPKGWVPLSKRKKVNPAEVKQPHGIVAPVDVAIASKPTTYAEIQTGHSSGDVEVI